MKNIYTEIIINASPEEVWKVLMDFENYRAWNPFIHSISGIVTEGGPLKVSIQQPEGRVFNMKPRCLVVRENEEFKWLGHLVIKGLFDGEHSFRLKPVEGGKTKFIQSENFKGLLLSMLWKDLNTKTLKGFELMNTALKQQVETLKSKD